MDYVSLRLNYGYETSTTTNQAMSFGDSLRYIVGQTEDAAEGPPPSPKSANPRSKDANCRSKSPARR